MIFCLTWFTSKDEVMYAATHYRNSEIPNESAIKETADFGSYKQSQEKTLPKFKYYFSHDGRSLVRGSFLH